MKCKCDYSRLKFLTGALEQLENKVFRYLRSDFIWKSKRNHLYFLKSVVCRPYWKKLIVLLVYIITCNINTMPFSQQECSKDVNYSFWNTRETHSRNHCQYGEESCYSQEAMVYEEGKAGMIAELIRKVIKRISKILTVSMRVLKYRRRFWLNFVILNRSWKWNTGNGKLKWWKTT